MTPQTHVTALRVILLLSVFVGAMAPTGPARAGTITLTTSLDAITGDGLCSLREAIIAANGDRVVDACPAGNGADTIVLPAGVYPLTVAGRFEQLAATGDLDIYSNITLIGAGQDDTFIDGRVLDRVLEVRAGAVVQIDNVTLENGDADAEDGGGLHVDASTVTLTNSRIRDSVGSSGGGIRIENGGIATLINSRLSNNTSLSGGGLYVGDYPDTAAAVVINSLIDGNTASGSVGGSSGGGVRSAFGGDLTLVNTTISGNSAAIHGGGIFADNIVRLYNVTVTLNTADSDGDDNGNGGGVSISNGSPPGFVTSRNSIISLNFDDSPTGALHTNCSGTLTGEGHNLLGSTTGCTLTGVISGDRIGSLPFLGSLQDNGGPTLTHALLFNSAAIDAGDPAGCLDQIAQLLTTDQRGYFRPIDGDGDRNVRCDIGAFEYNSPGTPAPTATLVASPAPTSTASSTPTPTRTATTTTTSAPTTTPTVTSTATRTATRTATATAAVSATATRTATAGASLTATRTSTATTTQPTTSPTPTRTGSTPATSTPTPSRTITPPIATTPIPPSCSGYCLALPELHRP